MSGRYEVMYDTISNVLRRIADGMNRHDYCIIPVATREDWKKLGTFVEEEFDTEVEGCKFYNLHFLEDGRDWYVTYTKCEHPDPGLGKEWLFIDTIIVDGTMLASSKMTYGEYLKYIAARRAG